MPADLLLQLILNDDALTRGLGDAEARVLIEWLVDRAERMARDVPSEALAETRALCRRARAIARFVALWTGATRGAAVQLAGAERFEWPLPATDIDPCVLMQQIVAWEQRRVKRGPLPLAS